MKKKIKCFYCKGKGTVNRPQPISCPNCGGVKWICVSDKEHK